MAGRRRREETRSRKGVEDNFSLKPILNRGSIWTEGQTGSISMWLFQYWGQHNTLHYFVVLLLMCNCAPFKVERFVKMASKFLGYPCFECLIEVIKFCLYIPLSCSSLQKLSLKSRLESGYCRIGGQGPHIWEYLKYSWTVELNIATGETP